MKFNKKVPFIEQMEHSECGLACLAMILGFFGHNISLTELRNQVGAVRAGMSMQQLQEIGSTYHLTSRGYRAKASQLNELTAPLILLWDNQHFVVLEKIKKKKAIILDPAFGRLILSLQEFTEKYSGFALSLIPVKDFRNKRKIPKWTFYIKLAFKSRKLLISVFLVSILLQGLGISIPKVTQFTVDNLLESKNYSFLITLGGAIFTIFVFSQLFQFLRGYLIAKLQSQMDTSMMTQFIDKLFKLPFDFFENRKGGELVFRANSNVTIRRVLSNRVITILIDGLLLITYGTLMINQLWQIGLIVTIVGFIMLLIIVLSSFITHRLSRKEISSQAEMHGFLSEHIHGITDVKVLGFENRVFNKWEELFKKQLTTTEKRVIWNVSLDSMTVSIQFVFPLLILWIGFHYVLEGWITLGGLLGLQTLSTAFMVPIASLGSTLSELVTVGSYIQRIQDVIESVEEPSGTQKPNHTFRGYIKFKDVSFNYYRFGKYVLKDINLEILPGEKVAIVGASGSGKSTLAKLILGLYTASLGEVSIDNIPLNQWHLSELRQKIGVILQETKLFNVSILDNIAMDNGECTIDMVVQAAKQADIHRFIMSLPLGYQTVVSENGLNFSGGQRQRILLARAFLAEPQILLLDEATSSLDSVSEQLITDFLQERHCTQIMIAHRLSTIQRADRIIVLDQGEIIEQGNHQELIDLKGQYFNLYNSQKTNVQFEPVL
ncbi:peptidase domain-containing ABC transporter [Paenibacillus polymyxa]|nr:peptidase domain-containing ABC transporter [Paenibacillus polymyxa]MDY7993233.1 peptidase domain-containing ABC transporter [Paenibacillus polymyxa]MDY8119215.1 peptidase domain-containing ABC transporter [Paenibacillus polymyxa]